MQRVFRFVALSTLVALSALILAACGGGSAPAEPTPPPATTAPAPESAQPAGEPDLRVEMHDIYFGDNPNNIANPPVWQVRAGQEIQIELDNQGNLEHNWVIVNAGERIDGIYTEAQADKLYWESANVRGGESASFLLNAPPEIGEYLVICSVAGHYPAMQGRLVVGE
jgi:uncharacterized cupredoxin-like copper-binding protein